MHSYSLPFLNKCNLCLKITNLFNSLVQFAYADYKTLRFTLCLSCYMRGLKGVTGFQDPPPGKSQVAESFLRNTCTDTSQKAIGPNRGGV